MFVQNIDPVFLRFGFFEIRYYGLIFALGFLAGYFFLRHLAKKRGMGLSDDDISDYTVHLIIGSVLGARLFEVLFYEPTYYFTNPSQILAVWKGGLSIHGGIIGAMIAGYYFAKKRRVDFWKLADITVIPLSFALIFGRIANFLNSEFVGKITDIPWAVKFLRVDPVNFRHPVQLYEALKNAVIFIALWSFFGKKKQDGWLFWSFIFMYSVMRFFIEFYKEWDNYFLALALPQWISLLLAILAAWMLYRAK